jgi:hypothetical protein
MRVPLRIPSVPSSLLWRVASSWKPARSATLVLLRPRHAGREFLDRLPDRHVYFGPVAGVWAPDHKPLRLETFGEIYEYGRLHVALPTVYYPIF